MGFRMEVTASVRDGVATTALREVDSLIKEGFTHVVDADLQAYFDTIPHDRLMAQVEAKVSDGVVQCTPSA